MALPQWDLSDLFPSMDSKELAEAKAALLKEAEAFQAAYEGTIAQLEAEECATAIAAYETLEQKAGRISSYSYLRYCTDMEDEAVVAFFQDAQDYLNQVQQHLMFFTLELGEVDEATYQRWYAAKEIQQYGNWLRQVRAFAPYQLSKEVESVLLQKSQTSRDALVRLFDETMSSLAFNWENKSVSLAPILHQLSDADEAVRKAAFAEISRVFSDNSRLFCFITNTLAKDKAISDTLRGLPAPITSRNISNDVEDEVVDVLLEAVKEKYNAIAHRYYGWKATQLGKEKLEFWDRGAPLPFADDVEISWEEGKEIVLKAYREFMPEMAELAEQFFDKHWIDAAPKPGKESGAFSHPTVTDAHPYILMNYQGKMRDVMTLAHELGHGIHQLLAREQGELQADTPLTIAETASVFGEMLTFTYLLERCTNEAARTKLIAEKIEDMINTVMRQIAFCEFEIKLHAARKEGELSSAEIAALWQEVQKDSLGDAFVPNDAYDVFWMYIPHFIHTPFYVYAYAFGECVVQSLFAAYESGMNGFKEAYTTLLRSGGSQHYSDALKPFGFDLRQKTFWQQGLEHIEKMVDELC